MPDRLMIRRAQPHDAATIARFNAAMASETEDKTLDPETARAGTEALIDHPEHGFYLVAERAGERVASLLITTEWSDWRAGLFWWIQSVYVRPEHRRQGVYAALYAHAKRLADEAPEVCGLRLYVDCDNQGARATYKALGMTQTNYRMYEEYL